MAARSTTADTILDAAQRSIRQRGPQKLSLSAVATEAGVSRPTVYRWFPTKTLLLAAIAAHEVEQFDLGLQELADSHDDPGARFDAALHYLVAYLDETIGSDAISADPAFALQSVARVLGDALDEIPTVRSGALTREQGAEMLLRVAYSHYLVPSPDPEQLLLTLRSFAGVETRITPRRRRSV